MLDVEPAALLARALEDEVAQAADGGLVGQGQPQHQGKKPTRFPVLPRTHRRRPGGAPPP